jgi:SAM-dependent methyltransferase
VSTPRPPGGARYLLGHGGRELERLDLQGELYRDATTRAFRSAGLVEGMSVLDVGCGTGDVSLTAASLVGPKGRVLGIDRGEAAVAAALQLGEEELDGGGRFDALVGRFVLMHQNEPGAALASAARAVRSGGVVSMVESYMELLRSGGHSEPHSALYDEIVRWKCAVVEGAGADVRAGARLRRTFLEAGLPEPVTRLEAPVEGGTDSLYYDYVALSVRSMLPEAERLGLRGFSAEDVDTLAGRLREEVVALGGTLVVCAWCRTA